MAFTDRVYNVNWNKLVVWMLPTFMRSPILKAFLQSVMVQINETHNRFIAHKNYIAYWLEIDSQVWRMEKALNDKYDTAERRIVIVDALEKLPTPFYRPQENKPVVLRVKSEDEELVLYTKQETAAFSVDFIVKVPLFVNFDMVEMRAFIDTFKTPSKTYKVQIV
ncbi:MAG: hypothetical protein JWP81_10 [Ferruginibacter sp.]|nr:hypothetical protein [Ferruginibacter sp.]